MYSTAWGSPATLPATNRMYRASRAQTHTSPAPKNGTGASRQAAHARQKHRLTAQRQARLLSSDSSGT